MTVSRLFPTSPRRRRRLARVGLLLVVVAASASALLILPGGKKPPPETFSNEQADIYRPERPVKLDRKARREIGDTLERFVRDGLGRRDPVAAYRLATSQLRAGISLSDWKRGELPVFPYLAREGGGRAWTKDYAFGDTVGVELFLQPAAAEKMGPIAFKGAVRRIDGRWLVDSVVPAATFSRAGEKVRVFANVDFQRGELGAGSGEAKLSASWLFVPVGLLAVALFVPLGIFAVRVGRAR